MAGAARRLMLLVVVVADAVLLLFGYEFGWRDERYGYGWC